MSELKAVETEKVEPTQEQQEQEAAAALSAGYNRVKGNSTEEKPVVEVNPDTAVKKEDAKKGDEVKADKETDRESVVEKIADEWDGVPVVVRKKLEGIDGKIGTLTKLSNDVKTAVGRFQSEVAAARSVAKTVERAPTPEQIAAASQSLEKWEKLKGDFEDWSAGIDERIAERIAADRAKFQPQAVDVDGIKREVGAGLNATIEKERSAVVRLARAFGRVDAKYPDWESDVHLPTGEYTPEFSAWESQQAPDIRALADSESAADALKMLDMYYDHRKAEAKREKNQARLATVVAPKQASSGGPTVLPDEAGLAVGYNRMAKRA